MKKRKIFQLILIALVLNSACSEEDDYKKYLEGGEIYYPGKIVNTNVYSGHERVRLTGLFVSDPKVTQCLVYWNVRKDSVIFPVSRENLFDSLDEVISVPEGIHNFEFITMDDDGHRSLVVNKTGYSYGEKYIAQLINRVIKDTLYSAANKSLTINWASTDLTTGAFETEVIYTTNSGSIESVKVPVSITSNETSTKLPDYSRQGFKYRTFFKPDTLCIDTFYTDFIDTSK
jgi:hypothetical protein